MRSLTIPFSWLLSGIHFLCASSIELDCHVGFINQVVGSITVFISSAILLGRGTSGGPLSDYICC